MSTIAPVRRSTRERRIPSHLLSPAPAPAFAPASLSLASSPRSSQLHGGSSDGGDQAAPGLGGKVSKAGQRRQQRTASHPYKPAQPAARSPVSVCDGTRGAGVGVDVDVSGVVNEWSADEWSELIKAKELSVTSPMITPAPFTDFDCAAPAALFDESVCPSPFTLHTLPKLPAVSLSLYGELAEDCSYSEPLSPVSSSSVDESVFTSMSSTAVSSRSLSSSSSSVIVDDRPRCPYPSFSLALHHHDHILGRSLYHHPSVDTTPTQALNRVYAMLCLAVLCTGLDLLVLRKWEDLHAAFDEFDVAKVGAYGPADIERLHRNPKVMKDKVKITAIIQNANAIQRMETAKPGSFLALLWSQHSRPSSHPDHFPEAERILPPPSSSQSASLPACDDTALEVDYAAVRTAVLVADGHSPSRAVLRLKLLLSGAKLKRMGDAACLQFAQSIGLVNHHTRACYCWQMCEDEYQQVLQLRQSSSSSTAA